LGSGPIASADISPKLATDLEKFQADNLAVLQKIQALYFATRGRYWQGIITPDTPPDELTTAKAPVLTKKPTDQAESWADEFKGVDVLPATWPAQMQVDVYEGPKGHGYTVTLYCLEGGKKQKRTWNYGPEDWRQDKDWVTLGETTVKTPLKFASLAQDEAAAEEVVDKLIGVKRAWYVRFILWVWNALRRIVGKR